MDLCQAHKAVLQPGCPPPVQRLLLVNYCKGCFTWTVCMQGSQVRYTVDPSERRCSGSFSQLLTGNTGGSMVFVPYKKPSPAPADKMPCGSPAMYADNEQPMSTAPEPYEILMPVHMADGRMLPMPSGQPKVCWTCLFDGRHTYRYPVAAPASSSQCSCSFSTLPIPSGRLQQATQAL